MWPVERQSTANQHVTMASSQSETKPAAVTAKLIHGPDFFEKMIGLIHQMNLQNVRAKKTK